MHTPALVWMVSVLLAFITVPQRETPRVNQSTNQTQKTSGTRQLAAVRGEVTKIAKGAAKGTLLITVTPAKDFQEVTVLARENDLVGSAVGRAGESDLLGLLSDDSHDDETITAAELTDGDIVSVIYDPQQQNRVLEIYVR